MSHTASLALGMTMAVLTATAATAADGAPDFAPNGAVGWVSAGVRLLPPPSGPGPVGPAQGRALTSNNEVRDRGAQALFPMGDPNAPILQPWARDKLRERNEGVLAGKPGFSLQASCWPAGVPGFLLYAVQPVYFVQTPKEVLLIWQADHQVRHVYMDVPHSANVKPSWFGESVGRYEGDTLVVDTIGVTPRAFIDMYETPHTEQLHTIERYRMTDNGLRMEVNLHVEDPGAFTMPWNAVQRYRRVEPGVADNNEPFNPLSSSSRAGTMLEVSCAENPNSLFGAKGTLPVPQTTKPDF